jgi:hypothetical protein
MKEIIIRLTQVSDDGSSLAQAKKVNYNIVISVEKICSDADYQQLKEIVNIGKMMLDSMKSNQSAEPGSSQE